MERDAAHPEPTTVGPSPAKGARRSVGCMDGYLRPFTRQSQRYCATSCSKLDDRRTREFPLSAPGIW